MARSWCYKSSLGWLSPVAELQFLSFTFPLFNSLLNSTNKFSFFPFTLFLFQFSQYFLVFYFAFFFNFFFFVIYLVSWRRIACVVSCRRLAPLRDFDCLASPLCLSGSLSDFFSFFHPVYWLHPHTLSFFRTEWTVSI